MSDRRFDDLLIRKALEGLEADAADLLEKLLAEAPERDRLEFERVAARLHLAMLPPQEPLPDALRAAVLRDAAAYFAARD